VGGRGVRFRPVHWAKRPTQGRHYGEQLPGGKYTQPRGGGGERRGVVETAQKQNKTKKHAGQANAASACLGQGKLERARRDAHIAGVQRRLHARARATCRVLAAAHGCRRGAAGGWKVGHQHAATREQLRARRGVACEARQKAAGERDTFMQEKVPRHNQGPARGRAGVATYTCRRIRCTRPPRRHTRTWTHTG
jgi:hypothetical protein